METSRKENNTSQTKTQVPLSVIKRFVSDYVFKFRAARLTKKVKRKKCSQAATNYRTPCRGKETSEEPMDLTFSNKPNDADLHCDVANVIEVNLFIILLNSLSKRRF